MFSKLSDAVGRRIRRSENFFPIVLSVAVGLAGGAGVIVLDYLIRGLTELSFEGVPKVFGFLGGYYVILLPAIGTVVVNIIVRKWAMEAMGHGVPEVMYAIRKNEGRMRPRVALVKTIASALCIGTGGSVGREDPTVQIGCSMGSTLGQLLGLQGEKVRLMVACGAAAAIGGAFNAPIAGVLFALEVILGSFGVRSFGVVVISSVTSTALCQSVLGKAPVFELTNVFHLHSPWELLLYLVLGVCMGGLALVYVKVLYFFEGAFERWRWNMHIKAFIGGGLMGVVGWIGIQYFGGRHLFGSGYDGINAALAVGEVGKDPVLGIQLPVSAFLALVVLKMLATSLVLSSGGSGGVFAPALYIGAVAGAAFGLIAKDCLPSIAAQPGAYALVGMAAVFSGAAHAPITSVIILFEMTGDYKIILPLMLAVVISYFISSVVQPDSIYTIKLRRRGGLSPRKGVASILEFILVADAMTPDAPTVGPDTSVTALAQRLHAGPVRSFPVIDKKNRLIGIVTEMDVELAITSGKIEDLTAADIMTKRLITCTPDETLGNVLQRFQTQRVRRIPVVDRKDPERLLGVLRREEIFWAYGSLADEHQRLLADLGQKVPMQHQDACQLQIQIKQGNALCFKRLREIDMPENCLIVVLRRADKAIVPRGDTQVEPGDVLTAVTTQANEPQLREWAAGLNGR